MAIDLQALVIKRLLENTDVDLFSKISPEYFSNYNLALFIRIQKYYSANQKLPSLQEFDVLRKDISLDTYFKTYIVTNEELSKAKLENIFVVKQLQDEFIKNSTLNYLDDYLSKINDMESVEMIESMQSHILAINRAIPSSEELFDVSDIEISPDQASFILHPSGLSHVFDSVNGGLAQQELVLLGGRRGSGKSIISLNAARHRFECGNTVAFFTIEMRYKEVFDRLMSAISGVEFLKIYKNEVTEYEKLTLAIAKLNFFYQQGKEADTAIEILSETGNFKEFHKYLKADKVPRKENRLFIIDDPNLTLSRVDHYCNTFKQKYGNKFNMSVVDYLNIIQAKDRMEWKTQIAIADSLKGFARNYDLTMMSPYQIAADGEARFAKGILDSADKSFIFLPPDPDLDPNLIKIHTSKIRNGQALSFDIHMDWPRVKIVSGEEALVTNRKPLGPDLSKPNYSDDSENKTDTASELINARV